MACLCLSQPVIAKGIPAQRAVWLGLERGPISPAFAEELENEIVTRLGRQKHIKLVDIAGRALSERALASHASALAKLIDRGIALLLRLKAKKAKENLDRAIKLFEAQLTSLRNHELLHDAMLAKAEAEMVLKQQETAKTTLKRLAALKPRQAPSRNTHNRKFVKLWEQAKVDLGHRGSIEVRTQPSSAFVQIDGRRIGRSPITSKPLPAGRHYIVARWPGLIITKIVQLSPGQNLFVDLKPSGPAYRLKTELFSNKIHRQSPEQIEKTLHKISRIADAKQALIGQVHQREDKNFLVISRFDDQGKRTAKGVTQLIKTKKANKNISTLVAAIIESKESDEFTVKLDGSIDSPSSAAGAGDETSGLEASNIPNATPFSNSDPIKPSDTKSLSQNEAPAPNAMKDAPKLVAFDGISKRPTPVAKVDAEEDSSPNWLLWTIIAVAVAGAATGGVFLLIPPPQTTQVRVHVP